MHQNPEERELWTEDLAWVQALIAHRHKEKVDGEEVSFIMQMRKKRVAGSYRIHIRWRERKGRRVCLSGRESQLRIFCSVKHFPHQQAQQQ